MIDERIKTACLLSLTCLTFGFAISILKLQEDQNALPTPVPERWKPVALGTVPKLSEALLETINSSSKKPILLNFYNPDCPCSRYNMHHLRSLVWRYGSQVTFIVVLQGRNPDRLQEEFHKAGFPILSVVDTDSAIARACGVISTPQAALLDRNHHLYYRGNYNQARYCSGTKTEFARLAIDALLSGQPSPLFPGAATTAYGCALPLSRAEKLQ